MKAAKSQQILPSDRKHLDPVGIDAHQDGSESVVLAASATARRGTLYVGLQEFGGWLRDRGQSQKSARCRREPLSDVEAREPRDPAGTRIAEQGLLHGVAH